MNWSRNIARKSILLVMVFALVACSQKPATLVRYSKDGVAFNHYSDWRVTEDAPVPGDEGTRSIVLEGPHDSIVSVIMVSPSNELTLDDFAAAVALQRSAGIKETLSIGSVSAADVALTGSKATMAQVAGQDSEGIEQQFSIKLLGQSIPHQAKFFMIGNKRAKIFFITQVSSEDTRHVAKGFATTLRTFRFKG